LPRVRLGTLFIYINDRGVGIGGAIGARALLVFGHG